MGVQLCTGVPVSALETAFDKKTIVSTFVRRKLFLYYMPAAMLYVMNFSGAPIWVSAASPRVQSRFLKQFTGERRQAGRLLLLLGLALWKPDACAEGGAAWPIVAGLVGCQRPPSAAHVCPLELL